MPTKIVALLPWLLPLLTPGPSASPPQQPAPKILPRYEGKPLEYWVALLQNGSNEEQKKAAVAIAAFGPDATPAVPKLVEMLDDRSEWYRQLVGATLCELGTAAKSATPVLVRSLKDKTARSPGVTIAILGSIGADPKEVLPVLIPALEDRQQRDIALRVICSFGPAAKEALPALRRAIRDEQAHDDEQKAASLILIEPLAGIGADAVPLLMEFLQEKSAGFQSYSADALAKIGPAAKPALPALVKLLKSDDSEVRRDVAIALWKIDKNTEGVPALAALLKEPARYLAEPAAMVLGQMGPAARPALPELREALMHPNEGVRDAVLKAISKIDRDSK
jgi:HEAT repeat protein